MNTKAISNRKKELKDAIKAGMNITEAISPAELLALVISTDPLDVGNGCLLLSKQLGLNEDSAELDEYLLNSQMFDNNSHESARETFLMDDVRKKRNKYKYENGLLTDDEILAFTLFLISDADLISAFNNYGEIEYDDISDLINHVSSRMKFLLQCFAGHRYDILNTVCQYVRENKTGDIDTFMVYTDVGVDDGGVIDYFKKMTDTYAFNPDYENELSQRIVGKRMDEYLSEVIPNSHLGEINSTEREDYGKPNYEEPLVERDFEG